MESESRSRIRSSSRRLNLRRYDGSPIHRLSLEIVGSPKPPPYSASPREILMLCSSPVKTSPAENDGGSRTRCKSKNNPSPKGNRRSRRRLEQDLREWREVITGDEISFKPRKKNRADDDSKPKEEKKPPSSAIPVSSSPSLRCDGFEIWAFIHELITWKDVARSSLWFGFGVVCFFSACFTSGVNFSIFSILSHLGILWLALSFTSNSLRSRDDDHADTNSNSEAAKLTEEHVMRVGKLILPAANLAVSKTRQIFSGEPAITLKVAPVLFLGSKCGHLLTVFRLCALCFFIGFTAPKLYSSYSSGVRERVESAKSWGLESWRNCRRKKMIAGSTLMAFWNLTSTRTRLFAAFMCLVIIRYRKQGMNVIDAAEEAKKKEEEQTLGD